MNDLPIVVGVALLAVGFATIPGWLAVVGAGLWRRGTAGGRLAVAAAGLLAPFSLCLLGVATVIAWQELFLRRPAPRPTPEWLEAIQEAVDAALPYAIVLFPAGLALVALAARAALVAASRRLVEPSEGGAGE
ncbi:hypothetical protein [Alienimonas californiensis]|uniref:Uncharacterized protein n=1 Tax=Alienimonas californiensis TaxID=2527989 RepID=A0A517P8U3_9PLAN|nr:hypothetical protein [Alienimonas californiensis]QDT15800.1 hypothetical protein CA12_18940 [Alienimonas californiensis]